MLIRDEIKNAIKELEEEKQLEKLENKKASKLRRKQILFSVFVGFVYVIMVCGWMAVAAMLILKANMILKVYPMWAYILLVIFWTMLMIVPAFIFGYQISFDNMEDEDADNR